MSQLTDTIIEHAEDIEKKEIKERRRNLLIEKLRNSLDYTEILKEFLHDTPIYYDKNKIWWLWDIEQNKWDMTDETDILIMIKEALDIPGIAKTKIRVEILESLKLVSRQNKPINPPVELIQFKNYIVNIYTGEKQKPTPKYFFTNPINWDIGKSDETPVMDKLFIEWVGEENKQLLYEIIAYGLYRDYPIHRIFCFIGGGRNGKSKYLGLISKFIGDHNSSSTELDLLLERSFESIKLYKKLICVMGETNYNALKKTAILKKLSGQDLVGFEIKGKTPFDDYNYAKIMISTNGIPITHDKSDGFYRRWLIIKFPNQFKEGKDILSLIPDVEYENLAYKCLKLLPYLLDRGHFWNEPSIEDKKKMYEDESNPLNKFLKENCEDNFNSYIYKYEFNDKFTHWLKEHGYRSLHNREVNSIMREYYEDSKKHKENSIIWAWVGIKWKEKSEKVPEVPEVPVISSQFPIYRNQPKTIGTSGTLGTFQNKKSIKRCTKNDILSYISDDTISTESIYNHFGVQYKPSIERLLNKMKEEGEIYNPKPDFWRCM